VKGKGPLVLVCRHCNERFRSYPSNHRIYCSQDCVAAAGRYGVRLKTHGQSYTRLYQIWSDMKARCKNPHLPAYAWYGGRGIKVCSAWQKSFRTFQAWALSHGYAANLTLDRKNSDKGYSPSNCRWIPKSAQSYNTRKRKGRNITSRYKGVSKCPNGRWRAGIFQHGKFKHIGVFKSEIKAAEAYDKEARKRFGEFARPNFTRKRGVPS